MEEICVVPGQPSGLGFAQDGALLIVPWSIANFCVCKAPSLWRSLTSVRSHPSTATTWWWIAVAVLTSATSVWNLEQESRIKVHRV